jgi:hypothetical protein
MAPINMALKCKSEIRTPSLHADRAKPFLPLYS